MREAQGENGRVETGIEEAAAYLANDADPNKAAAAPASVDIGFDTTPVTATVNPAPAPESTTVETGFADLDGTPAPVQQAAPTVNTMADTGEGLDVDQGARVAGLLANKSTTNWNAVSAFMREVIPWPGGNDPGHVGLWFRSPNQEYDPAKPVSFKNKPDYMTGWPFRDLDQFVRKAGQIAKHTDRYRHIYFCTSRQAKQGLNKRGNPKAQKSAQDALYQKSIFVDIDVDANDPKKYPTKDVAWQEFSALRKKLNLPPPSAVVDSGGGLQVFYISDKPLLPHEWTPYAKGLKNLFLENDFKFDPTCTADIARIMRMPGTFNTKYNPIAEAKLLTTTVKTYDFAVLDFLKKHAGQAPAQTAQAHQLFAEGADMASFKAGPIF
jgi:hypothetical protein